jgi:alpha-L-fucosidase
VDWHHPDYRTASHQKYIEYMHGQLREICSNYGQIDIIWFDGLGGTAKDWDSENLFRMIRQLQPHVIINNRAGLPADHDTPEQTIGKFQRDRPWETCMTICQQWAWKPNDRMKSLKECIHTLVRVTGGDGNLLFNVGPMPDGRIDPAGGSAQGNGRLAPHGEHLPARGPSDHRQVASTYKGNTICPHPRLARRRSPSRPAETHHRFSL